MGTISQKLEYLNGTKSSLKTAINNLGGDITNETTFRNYANVLNDVYSNLPKVSDTGTNVSLSPTLKGRLGIVPKGNTYQDGEPTPETPVEIQSATGTQKVVVSGKNLFDEITELGRIDVNTGQNVADNNYLRAKNYISVTPNTNYYIFIGSLGTTSSDWIAVETYDKNKNFISNLGSKINKTTFTTPNDCYYIRLYYGSGYGTTYKNDTAIIKGTSGTYQPYQEPQEVDIELSSRNLFNKDNTTDGYYMNNSTGELQTNASFCVSNKINVKPNTQYYINSNINRHLCYFDKENNFISGLPTTSIFTKGLITTPSNASYMYYSPSIEDKNTLQIVEGTEALETYIPYYNYTLNKIGDYEDYIGGTPDNWVLYKNIGKVVLDGNNYKIISKSGTSNNNMFFASVIENILKPASNSGVIQSYSNCFTPKSIDNMYVNNILGIGVNRDGAIGIGVTLENQNNTVTLINTWLSSNNVKVIYPLATTEQISITDTNLISQLNELYYLMSYNDTTNIDVTGNLPMRITASAIKGA